MVGRGRGRSGRGGGGNRWNEPGEASSSKAATQEESLPSDSSQPPRPPTRARPPSTNSRSNSLPPRPPTRAQTPSISSRSNSLPPLPPRPPTRNQTPSISSSPNSLPPRPPTSARTPSIRIRFKSNNRDLIEAGDSSQDRSAPQHSAQRDFPAAREVQPQRQGALQLRDRNLAGSSQQTGQSDSFRSARKEEPVPNLQQELAPPNTPRRRRTAVYQQGPSMGMAQNQGLPQQAQVIDSQQPAFNAHNFNAPAPGLPAGQVPVQGMGGSQALVPLPNPRPFLQAKPDPPPILPFKKRRMPTEMVVEGNQAGAGAQPEGNPPEEQQGNPDDID